MFRARIKILKFETRNVLLGIFRLKLVTKTIVIFGISTLEFAEMQKIVQNSNNKNKIKFGTKNALFGYFGM